MGAAKLGHMGSSANMRSNQNALGIGQTQSRKTCHESSALCVRGKSHLNSSDPKLKTGLCLWSISVWVWVYPWSETTFAIHLPTLCKSCTPGTQYWVGTDRDLPMFIQFANYPEGSPKFSPARIPDLPPPRCSSVRILTEAPPSRIRGDCQLGILWPVFNEPP